MCGKEQNNTPEESSEMTRPQTCVLSPCDSRYNTHVSDQEF